MPSLHDRCAGLSDLGRQQVTALAARLSRTGELDPVDAVYTSLATRAVESHQLLADVLTGQPVAECDWCESHPGDAEGVPWAEFDERFPNQSGATDPFERRIPGGESWAEFYARAGARLKRIAHEHRGQRVVVVTHGGVIGASFVALGDLPIGRSVGFIAECANASITEWRHAGSEWRLARYNDAAHLAML